MGKTLKYAGEYRKYINWATFLTFLSVICIIVAYYLANKLLVGFLSKESMGFVYVMFICGGIALSKVIKGFLQGWGLKLSHEGAFGTLYNMRVQFAKDVTNHSLGEIIDNGTGVYKKGFVEDINNLEKILAHFIPEGYPNIFLVIILYVIIFIADWRMGFLSLASLPLGIIPTIVMFKKGLKIMPKYYKVKNDLNSTIIEYISGMEVIKVFGNTAASYGKYVKSVEMNRDSTIGWFRSSWKIQAIVGAGLPCTMLLTLPVGTYMYSTGVLSLDVLILVLMFNLSMAVPLTKIISFLPFIPSVNHAVKNLELIFNRENVCCGLRTQKPENYEVRFENVSFAYQETDVIGNLSLVLHADTLTAFVGESGSGKSTLARLLVHYWDVKSGRITIGGIDIREFTNETLMSMVSYVAQDTLLFSGTIADNIAMGKVGATRDEIIEAAKSAACHDFIIKLENGYDTEVGTLGGKLSGGERQRVTIARAILKDAPIVILDEATAFADAENEALIQQALSKLLNGKTSIVIAHRLNTIINADNIIVLENGEIHAQDPHKDLLKSCPLYKNLWERSERAVNWSLEI